MKTMRCLLAAASLAWLCSPAWAASWDYSTSADKLTDKTMHFARVQSSNSLALGFPYRGRNHGYITVRQHPQYGLDVIIRVDKGQILCRLRECSGMVRFNEEKAERLTLAPPHDHDSTVVFARYPDWMRDKLKGATRIIVQLPMYQEGNQTLEFELDEPLVWPPK